MPNSITADFVPWSLTSKLSYLLKPFPNNTICLTTVKVYLVKIGSKMSDNIISLTCGDSRIPLTPRTSCSRNFALSVLLNSDRLIDAS